MLYSLLERATVEKNKWSLLEEYKNGIRIANNYF